MRDMRADERAQGRREDQQEEEMWAYTETFNEDCYQETNMNTVAKRQIMYGRPTLSLLVRSTD